MTVMNIMKRLAEAYSRLDQTLTPPRIARIRRGLRQLSPPRLDISRGSQELGLARPIEHIFARLGAFNSGVLADVIPGAPPLTSL